jgi:hypothetical protein
MAAERRVRTFRLEDDLWAGLERIRDRDGVTVGEQIRRAIRDWLDKKTKTERKRVSPRKRG